MISKCTTGYATSAPFRASWVVLVPFTVVTAQARETHRRTVSPRSGGEEGQDAGPGVVAGLRAELRRARPEERVPGARVADQLIVGPGRLERRPDLSALAGVDQEVILADQVKDPAADPR